MDLVEKRLVTDQIVITIGYDTSSVTSDYTGEVRTDWYGRKIPKHAHGTGNIKKYTSSTKLIMDTALELYDRIIDPKLLVRRLYVVAGRIVPASSIHEEREFEQLDLFTDYEEEKAKRELEAEQEKKERNLQAALLGIHKKYGKNAILHGTSYQEGATGRERNEQVGGHRK